MSQTSRVHCNERVARRSAGHFKVLPGIEPSTYENYFIEIYIHYSIVFI